MQARLRLSIVRIEQLHGTEPIIGIVVSRQRKPILRHSAFGILQKRIDRALPRHQRWLGWCRTGRLRDFNSGFDGSCTTGRQTSGRCSQESTQE